jgi:hypothetical protein
MDNKYTRATIRRSICFILLILLTAGAMSCKKTLEVDSSHLATEERQWKSITDTRSGLIGIYGLFRAALADNNAHWLFGELRNGDFVSFSRSDLHAIHEGSLNASFPIMEELKNWRRFYAVINSASVFIERAPEVQQIDPLYTDVNLKIDIAQARALRAFAYFYMVRIWGDVPLITSSHDNGSFEARPRSDKDIVLAFAENELLAAAQDLPYKYGVAPAEYYNETEGRWNGVLFTKNSAYAILAHLAAWKGNYLNADVYTDFVMNNYSKSSIDYSTIEDLTSASGFFNGKNARQMVAFNFVDGHGESTASGHLEQLTLAQPLVLKQNPEIFVPKDSISVIFNDPENRDIRFGIDTVSGLVRTNYFTNYSGATPIFSKLKVIRGGTSEGNFAIFGSAIVFSRLEDIVLLRAEALAVLGRMDEAAALLNSVRSRRSLISMIPTNAEELINGIFEERRRELMGEGHRWYDQVRYHKIMQRDPAFRNLIQQQGIYWPLAAEALSNNSALEQNMYWN